MSGIWQCVEKVPALLLTVWLDVPWLLVAAVVYGLYCAVRASLSRWPAMQALVGSVGSWGLFVMSNIWWCVEKVVDLLLTGCLERCVEKVTALLLQVLLVLAVPWLLPVAAVWGFYYAVRAGLSRVCSWGMYVTSGIKRFGGKVPALLLKVLLVLAVPVLLAMAVELLAAPGSTTAEAECRAAAAARVGVDAVLDIIIVTMIGLNSVGTLLVVAAAAADGVACSVGGMRAIGSLPMVGPEESC
jgi:hypothetical protein